MGNAVALDWYQRLRGVGSGAYMRRVENVFNVDPDQIVHLLRVIHATGTSEHQDRVFEYLTFHPAGHTQPPSGNLVGR